jgi:hypothetical protein
MCAAILAGWRIEVWGLFLLNVCDFCWRELLAVMMFWIEFIGSVRAYFLPKNVSFEARNVDCPCFIFQRCFQKPILLSTLGFLQS